MTDFAQLSFPRLGAAGVEDDDARRRGFAAGFAEGVAAGVADAAERAAAQERAATTALDIARGRLADAERALRSAAAELDSRAEPVIAGTELALAEAALELATAVLGRELSQPTIAAVAAAARAVEAAPSPVLRLRVSPAAAQVLLEETADLGIDGVSLVPDASLAAGDAVAETATGSVDATIASALDRVARALRTGSAAASTAPGAAS